MAIKADSQSLAKSKARWQVVTLLTGPFAAIGRAAIAWTGNLGASTIFLLLASLKIFGTKQLSKTVQQVYYIGARSITIIMLVSVFTGMVLGCNLIMPCLNSARQARSALWSLFR